MDEQVCREVVQVSLAVEIIALDNNRRNSSNQLQHQRTAAQATLFYTFM